MPAPPYPGAGPTGEGPPSGGRAAPRDKYVWNSHLMGGLLEADGGSGAWLVSLVHGSFRQCSLSLKVRPGHACLSSAP